MILQLESLDPTLQFVIWLIVGVLIVGLFVNLALRIVVSGEKAKDKLLMSFIVALLALLVVPLIGGYIGQGLSFIESLIAYLPWTTGSYLGALIIVVVFLLLLIINKLLLSTEWGHATWVTIISIFLLYVLYDIFPILYTFIGGLL